MSCIQGSAWEDADGKDGSSSWPKLLQVWLFAGCSGSAAGCFAASFGF